MGMGMGDTKEDVQRMFLADKTATIMKKVTEKENGSFFVVSMHCMPFPFLFAVMFFSFWSFGDTVSVVSNTQTETGANHAIGFTSS